MKKTLFLTIMVLVAITAVSAVNINPKSPSSLDSNQTVQIAPESSENLVYGINLDEGTPENETEVQVVDVRNLGNFTLSPSGFNSQTTFNNDGDLNLELTSPDEGGVSQEISIDFNITYNEELGNSSTSQVKQQTETLNTSTYVPYVTQESGTWFNKSYEFDFNGDKYNVSNIGPESLFLQQSSNGNNNSIELDDQQIINDVRITKQDIIPNEYVKLKAETLRNSDATFDYQQISVNKDTGPECTLGISTQGGTVLQRGSQFIFDTINEENGEKIGGVNYQLRKTTTPGGLIAEGTTSSNFASASVPISETLYQNSPDTEKVQLKLIKESSNCEPTSQTIRISTPYGDYIKNTDKFNLKLSVDNTTTYDNIEGDVTTKSEDEDVDNAVIEVKTPSENVKDTETNSTGFTFKPDTGGNYKVTATKPGYVDSQTKTVNYVADRDGDGVPNSQDQCPDVEGVPENNGCERVELYVNYLNKNGEVPEEGIIGKDKAYDFRVFNKETNDIESDFNGEISVEDGTRSIPFENGRAENIVFNETGSYELFRNTSDKYSFDGRQVTVENKGLFSNLGTIITVLFFGIIFVAGLILVARSGVLSSDSGGGGTSRKSTNERKSLQDTDDQNLGVDLDG